MLIDKCNEGQKAAVRSILDFTRGAEKFFLLVGPAGTGKTFTMQAFLEAYNGKVMFTAPTNKATKVLRDTLKEAGLTPECRTIYSALGLKMEPDGEVKVLTSPDEVVDLSDYKLIVVDEGSMVNSNLLSFITNTAAGSQVKFLFLADFAQLPPVGEPFSPIKAIERRAELTKVMRHDNQILELVTTIRGVVDKPVPTVKLTSNFEADEGVWVEGKVEFNRRIMKAAFDQDFLAPRKVKVIAWRNLMVESYNRMIRQQLFDNPIDLWLQDDRIIMLEPAKDPGGDGQFLATTDDEGRVMRVRQTHHPVYREFEVWELEVILDHNKTVTLYLPHQRSQAALEKECKRLAAEARAGNRKLWRNFWNLKEAFHSARHAYALTAHRAQGSTYDSVFVDWKDILINQNRQEAYRCLYVACSRPKKALVLG